MRIYTGSFLAEKHTLHTNTHIFQARIINSNLPHSPSTLTSEVGLRPDMSLSMAVSVAECRDTRTPVAGHGGGDTESGLAEAEPLEFNLHL